MPGLQFGVELGTRRLAALIGGDTARDMLQTSHIFDAESAHSCGFFTAITALDDWDENITQSVQDAAVLTSESRHVLMQ